MKTCIPINLAIKSLIDSGLTPRKAINACNQLKQPIPNYVLAADLKEVK